MFISYNIFILIVQKVDMMDRKKQQVLQTAKKLFSTNGYASTALQDIINQSKISKGTFYNYFSSKSDFLIAFLQQASEELMLRRQELQIGKRKESKIVFAHQLEIRMQINREYNLIPIYEAAFHSNDQLLKDFIHKKYQEELNWIASRLIDVYGKKSAPYTTDCAVLLLGMIQHITNYWHSTVNDKLDTYELIQFTIRRMDCIMPDMIEKKDWFIGKRIDQQPNPFKPISKQTIFEELDTFSKITLQNTNTETEQQIQFIKEELKQKFPRFFLLKPVLKTIRNTFKDTEFDRKANEVCKKIWIFMQSTNNEVK